MTKKIKQIWEEYFGNEKFAIDPFGRKMCFDQYNDLNSSCGWTIDHIWPRQGDSNHFIEGSENSNNLQPLHILSNQFKANAVNGSFVFIDENNEYNQILYAIKKISTDKNGKYIGRMKVRHNNSEWTWAYKNVDFTTKITIKNNTKNLDLENIDEKKVMFFNCIDIEIPIIKYANLTYDIIFKHSPLLHDYLGGINISFFLNNYDENMFSPKNWIDICAKLISLYKKNNINLLAFQGYQDNHYQMFLNNLNKALNHINDNINRYI